MRKHWVGLMYMVGLLFSNPTSAIACAENRPLVIILMGPPGSGKGTHAGPLSQQLHLPHISTGDLFRENIRSMTPLGVVAKNHMDKGELVSDDLVINMLFDRTAQTDCKEGYILDGFPRTLAQARALDQRLKGCKRVIVLNFNLSDEMIIERVAGRIICKSCGRPYHKKFDPPQNELICDNCKGALIQRDDDKEEIIRKRLEVHRAQTEPLISYYANQKEVLREIDSQKEKEAVFQDVLEAVPPSLVLR